ncbi:hypothetical protein [Mycobacterium sp. DL592]|uniref:hypothetical protein n=1 Tax=Mycobacterium sp. DL592 TaxID=2675524 RepID=UPI001FBC0438|nr:hypothetical protein [Mycobacterium sp. DL592]
MLTQDSGGEAALSRRRVLADGGRGLVLLALFGGAITACGSGEPAGPDPLEQQVELARHDSELATAAAVGAAPALARAFTEVATERSRHAAALLEEIARVARTPVPTTSPSTTTMSAAAAPAPSLAEIVSTVRSSAESAEKLAPTLSGYRAGLLGSIAASCTTLYSVALPPGKRPQ